MFLAELGDKSMLISLTAAARYRWWAVLIPLTVATALLMGLAVVVGGAAGELLPERLVAVIAALIFIGFGLWTLRGDDDDDEAAAADNDRSLLRVMLAFGVLFFVAEFGDKTQLATLSLAGLRGASAAPFVWLGATLGMLAVNGLAIAVGARLNRVLPERAIRVAAGVVFIGAGVLMLVLAFA